MIRSLEQSVEMAADIVPWVVPLTPTGTGRFGSNGELVLAPDTAKAIIVRTLVEEARVTVMGSLAKGVAAIAYHSSSENLLPKESLTNVTKESL